MLNHLRWQLTLVYIGVALGLVALISLGAYLLLGYYLQSQTDLALGYKMATAFRQFGVSPPSALEEVELAWLRDQSGALQTSAIQPAVLGNGETAGTSQIPEAEEGETKEEGLQVSASGEEGGETSEHEESERYDAQLASIYVLRINPSGQIIQNPGVINPPFPADRSGLNAAFANGYDLRTVRTSGQGRIRLMTYRVDSSTGPFFFQVGRSLADQDRVRTRFLFGLLSLGVAAGILIGLTSWGISGKSILPAQRSWEQQQSFISNASHELRTPLTLIKATAEVMHRDRSANPDHLALAEDILTECVYIDRLVNDLLLLSRLDTRQMLLAREPVLLADLIDELQSVAKKLAGEKQIRLCSGTTHGAVLGDRQRLRQALLVLLDNAIRYSPPAGEIKLETRAVRNGWQVIVTDHGAGIPAEHLPHIFDRFYQANPTGEGQSRSNGLGLAIAKAVIEAQGGAIRIASEAGQGTSATIEMPRADGA